jgi:hypothetical protein
VSRPHLGVRRRYDVVRFDSHYPKAGWQWCHMLVSESVVATATMSASTHVTLRQGGSGDTCSSQRPSSLLRRRPPQLPLPKDSMAVVSRARLGIRRCYRNDVRLYSRYPKTRWPLCHMLSSVSVVATCLHSRNANIEWQWCHVLVSASIVTTVTTSALTRVTLRHGGTGATCSS